MLAGACIPDGHAEKGRNQVSSGSGGHALGLGQGGPRDGFSNKQNPCVSPGIVCTSSSPSSSRHVPLRMMEEQQDGSQVRAGRQAMPSTAGNIVGILLGLASSSRDGKRLHLAQVAVLLATSGRH